MPIITCPRCHKRYDPHCDDALATAQAVGAAVKVVCPACGQWLRLPEHEMIPAPAAPPEILQAMMNKSTLLPDAPPPRPASRPAPAPAATHPAPAAAVSAPSRQGRPGKGSAKSAVIKAEFLNASFHDQVSSTLLSMLWTLGAMTAMMFLVWLSTRINWTRPVAVQVQVLEDVGGGGGKGDMLQAGAEDGDFEEPVAGEASEVKEVDPEQSLSMISSLVSQDIQLVETAARASGLGRGEGTGIGDGRGKGPPGPGTKDGIPAWERWELRIAPKNVNEYTKQLDFFKIELGVVGGGNPNVDYISNLTAPKPSVRSGDPRKEARIRFLQRNGELRDADRQLAVKAGVNPQGRIVFQFYPQETYTLLLTLENEKMRPYGISDVRRTVFGIRTKGEGYEFYVIDQEIRVGATPAPAAAGS